MNMSRTYREGDQVEVRTAYIQQPDAEGSSRGFLGLQMKSKLAPFLPVLQAELDYGAFDPSSSVALDSETQRSTVIGAHSAWKRFKYGVRFQSMGRDFAPLTATDTTAAPGTDQTDLWVQRQFGSLSMRTFTSRAAEHPDASTTASHWASTAVGTTLDYTLASAPLVQAALTYSRQLVETFHDARTAAAVSDPSHRLSGTLSVRNALWNATLSSGHRYDCSETHGNARDTWTESLAVGVTPAPNFSVSPRLSYEDAPAAGHRGRTQTSSAGIALQFHPAGKRYRFTASSTVAARRAAAWSADVRVDTEAGVRLPFTLGGAQRKNGALALQLNYTEAPDAFAGGDDLLMNLQLSLHNFD